MTMVHIKINLIPTSRLYIFQLRFLRFPQNAFHPKIVVNHSLERVAALLMILPPYMAKQKDVFIVFYVFSGCIITMHEKQVGQSAPRP